MFLTRRLKTMEATLTFSLSWEKCALKGGPLLVFHGRTKMKPVNKKFCRNKLAWNKFHQKQGMHVWLFNLGYKLTKSFLRVEKITDVDAGKGSSTERNLHTNTKRHYWLSLLFNIFESPLFGLWRGQSQCK